MIYNFDTDDKSVATAALVVYATYRSRDRKRFKVTPEMWGQIQRFIKAAAKRSKNIPQFIDQFCKKMSCDSINPKWVEVAVKGRLFQSGSDYIDIPQPDKRQFLTEVLNDVEHKQVIRHLNNETQYIVMLVRDRLETEKPLESTFKIDDDDI
ncbi:hypothetical protein [Acinetobacter puyangensis]|uniref:hypothetical protein n=1 Tax=Acinetobacter puyangensis TaxID=1096779 RepID=UPI003A4D7D30